MEENKAIIDASAKLEAVKIEVLETTARLVPSDVVANSFSGVFNKSRTIWAEPFPSSAFFFILIRLMAIMPISDPEKKASMRIKLPIKIKVVVRAIMFFPQPFFDHC